MAEIRFIVGTATAPGADRALADPSVVTSTFERALDARRAISGETRHVHVVVGERLLDIAPQNFAAWAAGAAQVVSVTAWGWEPPSDLMEAGVSPIPVHTPEVRSSRMPESPAQKRPNSEGSLIAVVSPCGGSGKTMFSAVAGLLAARSSIETALVDLDPRFGDLEFVFDRIADRSLADLAQDIDRVRDVSGYGERVERALTVFTSPDRPEVGDIVTPQAKRIVGAIRREYPLTIVDTGSCWGEVHADLFELADRIVFMIEPNPVAVRAALRGWKLLQRLRVPEAKLVFVLNRWRDDVEVTPVDVAAALHTGMVRIVPDGGPEVAQSFGIGRPSSLLEAGNKVASGVQEILTDELPALGIDFRNSVPELFGVSRRRRW